MRHVPRYVSEGMGDSRTRGSSRTRWVYSIHRGATRFRSSLVITIGTPTWCFQISSIQAGRTSSNLAMHQTLPTMFRHVKKCRISLSVVRAPIN